MSTIARERDKRDGRVTKEEILRVHLCVHQAILNLDLLAMHFLYSLSFSHLIYVVGREVYYI